MRLREDNLLTLSFFQELNIDQSSYIKHLMKFNLTAFQSCSSPKDNFYEKKKETKETATKRTSEKPRFSDTSIPTTDSRNRRYKTPIR